MMFIFFVTMLFEVTIHCTSAGCAASEWECSNGTCILSSAVCDMFPDCSDESDEKNCTDTITCSEGQRLCFHSFGNFTCTNSATPCDCGSPGNIMYGAATLDDPTNSSAGASASVTCNTGYQTSTPILTCLPTGLWTNSICTAKDCGQLPSISAGSITLVDPKKITYGASANVSCFTGYQANVTSISCLASGQWESASCTVFDCEQLPAISAGSITLVDPKNTTYGASATVTCFTGYQANVTSVTCLASGQWESASCTVIDCGQLPPISAGSITLVDPKNTTYGASATLTCFTGYQTNVTSVTCLASGMWEPARCTVVVCGPVPNISFGSIHLPGHNNVTYGAEALVECDKEYIATKLVIKCLASGQWDIASCEENVSPAATLTPKDNYTYIIIGVVFGSILGGTFLIQLTVASGLHIKIYRISNRGGKAWRYIFQSAIPFIGIRYMFRYYKWGGYKKYQVNEKKKLPPDAVPEIILRNI